MQRGSHVLKATSLWANGTLTARHRMAAWVFAALLVVTALPFNTFFARPHFFLFGLYTLGGILLAIGEIWTPRDEPRRGFPVLAIIAMLLLVAGYILGLLHASRVETALLSGAHRFTAGALILFGALALRKREAWRIISRGAVLALLLHAIQGLFELGLHGLVHPATGVFGHANVNAMTLAILLPWAWGVARDDFHLAWRWFGWLAFLLGLIVLPFTRSAGAALALAVGWGLMAFHRWDWMRATSRATLLFVVAALAGGAVVWLVTDGDVAIHSRRDSLDSAWEMWKDAPWTGQGPGQFLFLYPETRSPSRIEYTANTAQSPLDHVHVEPLQTAVEGGVAAVVGLVLLVAVAGRSAWHTLDQRAGHLIGPVVWIAFAAAVVQGAVSLAPTRGAMVPMALAFGAALAVDSQSYRLTLHRGVLILVGLVLVLSIPLQVRRIQADRLYKQGRNWNQYWAVENPEDLRQALRYWPEELESRSLLMTWEVIQAGQLPQSSPRRIGLYHDALAQGDTLDLLAPQYFKTPLLRARAYLRLGEREEGLEALNRGDRFIRMREYHDLQEALKKLPPEKEIQQEQGDKPHE